MLNSQEKQQAFYETLRLMPTEEIQVTNIFWLTAFFDIHRCLLPYFKLYDNTIIANCSCKVIQNLLNKMKNRETGKVTDGIIILQDSVHPHVVHRVQREVLRHPAYSIDYHLQFSYSVVVKESNQTSYMYFGL